MKKMNTVLASISHFWIRFKVKLLMATLVALIASTVLLTQLSQTLNLSEPTVLATNIPNNQIISDPVSIEQIKAEQPIFPLQVTPAVLPPPVSAAAVIVMDLDSKTLLYAKDPDKRVPIASTTKIMTALISLGYYKPNDVLTAFDLSLAGGSTMGLRTGEKITFQSLLYGLLLPSGNDAAFTLAENYPGGTVGFLEAMNNKAQSLGLLNTHFDNPAGFDSVNHYSSASDLSKIAETAITNAEFAQVVSTKVTTVTSADRSIVHSLANVNSLLGQPGVLGIKTGYTPAAKENLVGLFERGGHRILTVVLGSEDRFGETEKLVNWTDQNFTWQR